MNGRKSKAIRREAEKRTVGNPYVAYNKKYYGRELLPSCTRWVIKQIKKGNIAF